MNAKMASAALPHHHFFPLLLQLVLLEAANGAMGEPPPAVSCDVVVAGGSTASLAAAITAAEAAPELTVCFTEITDWPGGQMTAGGVPAIDFGGPNSQPENQPASFRSAMASIPGDGSHHTADMGSGSPGACSVSTKCYLPNVFVEEWVMPRLSKSPNLKVFLRTTIVATRRDPTTGAVLSLTAVQRKARAGVPEWSTRLSDELPDWYSPNDSPSFTKRVLTLAGKIFIDATELGDVLATSGLEFLQGIETPEENSTTVDSTCGQAATLTFYAELLDHTPPEPPQPLPVGNGAGAPWTKNLTEGEFRHTWSWRRSFCAGNRSLNAVNVGDITQQNLGNDLDTAYLFPSLADVRAEAKSKEGWRGGVNLTALRMLEDRSYGWFSLMKNTAEALGENTWVGHLALNRTTSGTLHGLSKMVYWRDTRRAVGVDGFKLLHTQLRDNNASSPTGTRFTDSVAIGDYNDDTHHLAKSVCAYPTYMNGAGEGGKPYFIPLRALMVGGAPNLLAAGKLMSESFHANSNTRLHPSEWTSGVAAGGTAALMIRRQWRDTAQALTSVQEVRAFLNSSSVGQPLDWTNLPPPPPPPAGTTCALSRCIGVDTAAAKLASGPVYKQDPSFTCEKACTPLAPFEWLANMESGGWATKGEPLRPGARIYAGSTTFLKKSTEVSGGLPSAQKLRVPMGGPCIVVNTTLFDGYMLCIHHIHERN